MRSPWWFVGPALAVIVLFFYVPVLAALGLSLTDFDIYAVASVENLRWLGLENYRRLFDDPRFWVALRNTGVFVVMGGTLSVATSFVAALAVSTRWLRGRTVFRTIFFAPVVTTLVAVAVVWRYLYHPRLGPLAHLQAALGFPAIDWLGDPRWVMPALILLAVWKNFGFNMVVFMAGLQAIPERLYEAARLDGANAWQQLWHVTLPMLVPTTAFVLLMTAIGHFQLFAEPYVMTRGGPGDASLSVVLYMYEQGFRWWNMGYAAAIAFVLFGLILGPTALQLVLRRRLDGDRRPVA
jgi:multiple sugar transport system permease protein